MLFKNVIASALLIAGGLAAPLQAAAVEDNNHTKMSPREYWAFAIKLRENEMHAAKRNDHPNLVAREYWAFAIKLRSGVSAKRSILDSQCEIADEGIYCNYSSADIEAYGSTGHLQEGCITVETGVACFYPGSFTPNDNPAGPSDQAASICLFHSSTEIKIDPIANLRPSLYHSSDIAMPSEKSTLGSVLAVGCTEESQTSGLQADKRATACLNVPAAAFSTGSATPKSEAGEQTVVHTTLEALQSQLSAATETREYTVVKIGALFSPESVKLVSSLVQQDKPKLVLDMEPFFKTGPPPQEGVLTALRDDILPSTTVLCATVREAKALLDNAGIPIDYPQSIQDVQTMGQAVQKLGPDYVVMKREILGENDGMTTLHYVLCGSAEPQVVMSRFKNPKGYFGVSYSIPRTYRSSIFSRLRKGI
ncbi:Phosphomethylpyrimidine kinase type-1 [Cordyceps fumosorosea ARSEF 2679]|uniref:Phosphomethylpyrimidine kinase type-1 n=1 Tax=Cordyceps fumosorosea (strain ARSEF 2679) TaxID=1081104 RepID=A0A162MXV2_CORFA|nr:Phosphomethylpyrimidine kinase type-1 [Cordyceps fumosorosea ARSEF 2679]OAA72359.1 Phosphomethylpyrimidine kinase type-1 [Cordyceps fumosorosea ARSEF 2679]